MAYETLWHNEDLELDLLITLGSPLALPHAVSPRRGLAPVWALRSGRLNPIIEAVRPLAEVASAFASDRRVPGKTIIQVTH